MGQFFRWYGTRLSRLLARAAIQHLVEEAMPHCAILGIPVWRCSDTRQGKHGVNQRIAYQARLSGYSAIAIEVEQWAFRYRSIGLPTGVATFTVQNRLEATRQAAENVVD